MALQTAISRSGRDSVASPTAAQPDIAGGNRHHPANSPYPRAGIDQLTHNSTVSSILRFIFGDGTPRLNAVVTTWTLSSRSGAMTGALSTPGDRVTFTPGVIKTPKGQFRLDDDGTFTYVPYQDARRAAANGASYLGLDRDVFAVTAHDADAVAVRVSVSIAILAS